MTQLVVLNLSGDWQQGCAITAQWWVADSATPMQVTGKLPPAPELDVLYQRWQRLYQAVSVHRTWRRLRSNEFEIEEDEAYPTDVSESEFKRLCQELPQRLNEWLRVDSFAKIDRQLRTHLSRTDEIRLIIAAENRSLLRFPWHLWQFFEDYPKAELALSLPEYTRSIQTNPEPNERVKILAILGNSQGINITKDQQLLEQLPNTELKLLVEPDLETLNQQLWETNWDILFFAGHSSSHTTGTIKINRTDTLTIDQLRYGLRKAIERGLKLAIFNSCDGLGLAWDLADLHIPQVIVMREPVPDRVAQAFLKHFLFAFSNGASFYLAVRAAREQLQALESEFFCATWLPVICQNPAEQPPTWQQWRKEQEHQLAQSKIQTLKSKITRLLLSSVAVTGVVLGVRSLGMLQPIELWAYDRTLQLRPTEAQDSRLLIVTIDESEIQAQNPDKRRGSLTDQTLNRLLQTLEGANPRVIGLDIYRDFPTEKQYPKLIQQLRQNKRLVAICKSSDAKYDPTGIAPPPEMPIQQIGFSDFLADSDGVLRRQILFQDADPTSPCLASYAMSTKLAFRYLAANKITPEFTPEGNLKLGKTVFHRLNDRASGYQSIDAGGNQILLNYRSRSQFQTIAPQVTLSQVLSGKVRPEAIKDRIVLIGVIANSGGDFWVTPKGAGVDDRVPGVFVQAHMTSQIVSAVLDGRSLIWVWQGWTEGLWIFGWAIVGGLIGWNFRRIVQSISIGAIAIIGLTGISVIFITIGGWVPLVPASIAIVVTGSCVYGLNRKWKV
ncbi:MAG: CHASE2 domain-containing protein [Phormidium tanganyikae FI6-MK23]|jgi:CHASE2 domain-containing sensor protein|nr:CHASE2 domain-containing protein [Phormidium tanganyikae FI6-MK23]